MEEKEFDRLLVKIPELAPKMKACREAGQITLEEASSLSGLDVETLKKVENGEYCQGDEMVAYHEFFMKNIPNARELYSNFMDEILAEHGYTYDEEGNEYKDGVPTTEFWTILSLFTTFR